MPKFLLLNLCLNGQIKMAHGFVGGVHIESVARYDWMERERALF